VLASHYAAPVERVVADAAVLRCAPSEDSEGVAELAPGEPFALLDDSLGWAWGYGGRGRRVGYVPSNALSRGQPSSAR
jgi:hypothetical protein